MTVMFAVVHRGTHRIVYQPDGSPAIFWTLVAADELCQRHKTYEIRELAFTKEKDGPKWLHP